MWDDRRSHRRRHDDSAVSATSSIGNKRAKTENIGEKGDAGLDETSVHLDLLMLDEAQDLRPSFYNALCHIIRMSQAARTNQKNDNHTMGSLQMCIVGDQKQMLYDFPTFGQDKATPKYMQEPQTYWGKFTNPREWVETTLSTSYRLTPHMASFVNAIWGTSIQGGNTRVPNLPVEYICRYAYPSNNENDHDNSKLQTSFLSNLIDEYGPENIMFLAQSVKSDKCPIRVHVNALMKVRNEEKKQKYNFHIKESLRGFGGGGGRGSDHNDTMRNKVRVWTFCGSKGCEADCVVIFTLDVYKAGRVFALNQVGVALSRARKRLIVIHGKKYVGRDLQMYQYYPMCGDLQDGEFENVVHCEGGDQHRYVIPKFSDEMSRGAILDMRSGLTKEAIADLVKSGVISLQHNPNMLDEKICSDKGAEPTLTMYLASDFNYFAASEENRFLAYGEWIKESGIQNRIQYTTNVRLETTTEDVSALYGEAAVYMLQWQRNGYCPNIETVVNDGIICFCKLLSYSERYVREEMNRIKCEPLSPDRDFIFRERFAMGKVRGDAIVQFLNSGLIRLRKKRVDKDRTIFFPVKAVDSVIEDGLMMKFKKQIKSIYARSDKSPAQWIYLANAVMAFGQYHDKWNQIGTDPDSYDAWVEPIALEQARDRLSKLMNDVPINHNSGGFEDEEGGTFEHELVFVFAEPLVGGGGEQVVGVAGICDWTGQGLVSKKGQAVNLLEIKFVHELSNANRLQVLVYCALQSIEKDRACSGMLYNARTEELEICKIDSSNAFRFLTDLSRFKQSGSLDYKKSSTRSGRLKGDFVSSTDVIDFTQDDSSDVEEVFLAPIDTMFDIILNRQL